MKIPSLKDEMQMTEMYEKEREETKMATLSPAVVVTSAIRRHSDS